MTTASINPVTRIEGHLAVHTDVEWVSKKGAKKVARVTSAHCEGEMFRGLEKILEGRDPLDAQQIAQRICGVCPIPHGIASVGAQEMAYGIEPNHNGRLLQNLILAANYLHSHILHFYQLAALDFVDVKSVLKYSGSSQTLKKLKAWIEDALARKSILPGAPFLPRYEVPYVEDLDANVALLSHYVEALEVRRVCDEMAAVFGARIPHATALIPGGCTQIPNIERVMSYASRLKRVLEFVETVYLPDLKAVAGAFPQYFNLGRGCGNFLCFGAFPTDDKGGKLFSPGVFRGGKWEALDPARIAEDVGHSRFQQPSGLHPSEGQTQAAPQKSGAYSWIKAPRYRGDVMEVGALARVVTGYHQPGGGWIKQGVDDALGSLHLSMKQMVSVLGRHVARGLESLWIGKQALGWLEQLEVDGAPARDFSIPRSASGYGLTEAPRGALGHWLAIEDYRIRRYQCIVPTTWNCSPRDDKGQPGAVEQALAGTSLEDPSQPIELGRIVRSFDPCIACAVH